MHARKAASLLAATMLLLSGCGAQKVEAADYIAVTADDLTAPIIRIKSYQVKQGEKFDDSRVYSVTDNMTASPKVIVTGDKVDTSKIGDYHLVVTATDDAGNSSEAKATVAVIQNGVTKITKEEVIQAPDRDVEVKNGKAVDNTKKAADKTDKASSVNADKSTEKPKETAKADASKAQNDQQNQSSSSDSNQSAAVQPKRNSSSNSASHSSSRNQNSSSSRNNSNGSSGPKQNIPKSTLKPTPTVKPTPKPTPSAKPSPTPSSTPEPTEEPDEPDVPTPVPTPSSTPDPASQYVQIQCRIYSDVPVHALITDDNNKTLAEFSTSSAVSEADAYTATVSAERGKYLHIITYVDDNADGTPAAASNNELPGLITKYTVGYSWFGRMLYSYTPAGGIARDDFITGIDSDGTFVLHYVAAAQN